MADVNMLLHWDGVGEKQFEAGVDRGVLFVTDTTGAYGKGVAWNGLTAVNEAPSGAEENKYYADNIKYASILSAEDFGYTIEAYTSPKEFDACDGTADIAPGVTVSQQARKAFGFSWRSLIGNDVADLGDAGYIIHIAYGCKAQPSEKSRGTVNESPEPTTFSWTVATTPVNVANHKPTAHLQINSMNVNADKLTAFEEIIYGKAGSESYDAVTPVGTENPVTEGWYERSGSVGAYVYTLSADTTVDSSKTYYAKTTSGQVDPRLPLPDEIATFFNSQG